MGRNKLSYSSLLSSNVNSIMLICCWLKLHLNKCNSVTVTVWHIICLLPWTCTVICLFLTGKALFLFLGEMIPKLKSRQSKSSQSESSSQQQGAGASSKKKKGKKGKGKWNKTRLYLNNYFRERNKTMWPCTCILFSVFCNKGVVSTAS